VSGLILSGDLEGGLPSAKNGLTPSHAKGVLAGPKAWAMCVGAGVSSGAFPTWDDLARSFIRQDVGPVKGADVAKDLLKTLNA